MEYMFLIHVDSDAVPGDPSAEGFEEMMGAWFAYNQMMVDGGHFVSGASLQPPSTSTVLDRLTDTVTDGPFAETKEVIGGFYVVSADDLDQALELARAMPTPGKIEVRPVMFRPDA